MTSGTPQQIILPAHDYDLAATLASGQAFRWREHAGGWEGIIGRRWVWLKQTDENLLAETVSINGTRENPCWLSHYLQSETNLESVLRTFPNDEPMRNAIRACRGLRLLRQEPWECLASFILSSTKQIVQIQQIVALLCQRFGEPVTAPSHRALWFSFPTAARIAGCAEAELRDCKMGFRAPNLLRAAQMIEAGEVNLALGNSSVDEARAELLKLPGVGPKIANCVLLFGYGFQKAFPVDVWVMKALRELYFPKRRVSDKRIARFTATHFGPNAGYAQQYLFHYARTKRPRPGTKKKPG